MFSQLSGRDSLRDLLITVSIDSKKTTIYALTKNVSYTNFAITNEKRN